ncbi:gluconate 2-dehydrogenase subunit 3 family protein [Halobaculum litoreum]|uniref:Gluconate 2-dehydrogenase subunit 3 family protein n=1 Tax=Halobaculum litoreum TaxID=3031998 RepID=A0ABD5Y0H3_9EURY
MRSTSATCGPSSPSPRWCTRATPRGRRVRPHVHRGRLDADEEYAAGVAEAIAGLDDYARSVFGDRYAALDAADRLEALDVLSVDVVDPDPEGTRAQRVRHYVVNELLYAFYTSPTGASLAGLENPPGYPGGTRSYREGPDA